MKEPRKKGRPPRSENGPSTVNLTMRLQPAIYEAIREDAERYGRSISAQAERRLLYREPTASDAGRIVGLVIDAVVQRAGISWTEDEAVKRRCRSAADFALTVLFGPTNDADDKWTGQQIADEILGPVLVVAESDEEVFNDIMKDGD